MERIAAARTLSVAPMMDYTDRHFRYLLRLITSRSLLYTEMVTTGALLRNDPEVLLAHSEEEHPVALQIGGCDALALAKSTEFGIDLGFAEVNLNCGCPSDRVQDGKFGAVLMKDADLVASCVSAMIAAARGRAVISVKCRIGVDDEDPAASLRTFIDRVHAAGCSTFVVHARKAWLQGLSPRQNRTVPPLDYELVHAVARERPGLSVVLNGGLETLGAAGEHVRRGLSGAMLGRAVCRDPFVLYRVCVAVSFFVSCDDCVPWCCTRFWRRFVARCTEVNTFCRRMLSFLDVSIVAMRHKQRALQFWRSISTTWTTKCTM